MRIHALTQNTISVACQLFNSSVAANEMVYKSFTEAAFAEFFLGRIDSINKVNLLCGEEGFVSGCTLNNSDKAYITMIVVAPNKRRQGIGRAMLHALEEELLNINKAITQFEIVFFNPMNLTWNVPGTKSHDHPNAPGIDVSCSAYLFFKNMRYRDFSMQNSYYLLLSNYQSPKKVQQKRAQLTENGISIETYNASIHTGLDNLLQDLDSPLWTKELSAEVAKTGGGRPILVPVKDGIVAGFTGPLECQPSGRGFFAGIGVHSDYRGCGIANVLFSSLCEGLRDIGAEYMTLFTGEANPARNIYEAAGFRIVRTWANMRREVKK